MIREAITSSSQKLPKAIEQLQPCPGHALGVVKTNPKASFCLQASMHQFIVVLILPLEGIEQKTNHSWFQAYPTLQ